MKNTRSVLLLASSALALLASTAAAQAAGGKVKVCLVLPKAQLGQGSSGADVAEPVRQTLLAYLGGPATELVPLTARIPIQIDAEAKETGCAFVLYSSVTQKKGGGFGKLLAAAAPVATMMPGMAGMGGNYGTMAATQAIASAATTAASQDAAEEMQQQAMAALGGAAKTNIRKGDQVTLEYRLVQPGVEKPLLTQSAVAKAKENGEDLVSPLIEQAATAVLTAIAKPN